MNSCQSASLLLLFPRSLLTLYCLHFSNPADLLCCLLLSFPFLLRTDHPCWRLYSSSSFLLSPCSLPTSLLFFSSYRITSVYCFSRSLFVFSLYFFWVTPQGPHYIGNTLSPTFPMAQLCVSRFYPVFVVFMPPSSGVTVCLPKRFHRLGYTSAPEGYFGHVLVLF